MRAVLVAQSGYAFRSTQREDGARYIYDHTSNVDYRARVFARLLSRLFYLKDDKFRVFHLARKRLLQLFSDLVLKCLQIVELVRYDHDNSDGRTQTVRLFVPMFNGPHDWHQKVFDVPRGDAGDSGNVSQRHVIEYRQRILRIMNACSLPRILNDPSQAFLEYILGS